MNDNKDNYLYFLYLAAAVIAFFKAIWNRLVGG